MRCPEGRISVGWGEYTDKVSGKRYVRAGFRPADCRLCPSRPRCTHAQSRRLRLLPRIEHEAVAGAKARLETEAGRRLHDQRRGIEGTISRGVCVPSACAAHASRGSAKTSLQSVVTAAAMDLDRLAARFAGRPLAPCRTSRFAALAA